MTDSATNTIISSKRNVDGILLFDKPLGWSSAKAVAIVKKIFRSKSKVGHGGSLDPLATGMLPIFFGQACKFSQYSLLADKCYQVTAQLGVKTNTADAEGEIIATDDSWQHLANEQIISVAQQFIGTSAQMPPMYSAVKQDGKPLYKLARKGVEVVRQAREIEIYSLEIDSLQLPYISFTVTCSKGTYIRTLVEDIATKLATIAHVTELRRLTSGPFAAGMVTIAKLDADKADLELLNQNLLPVDAALTTLPKINLNAASTYYLQRGQKINIASLKANCGIVRVVCPNNNFIGIGEVLDDGMLAPKKLVATN